MHFPRISITQLLAGCVALCAIFALLRQSDSEELVWRTQPLEYSIPNIPPEFQDHGRKPPSIVWTPSCWAEYDDGPSLFLLYYRRGWTRCRSDFYFDDEESKWHPKDRNFTLSMEEWNPDHTAFAYKTGHLECSEQIDVLLNQFDESDLRKRLCYSKNWHTIPLLFVFLISISSIQFLKQKRIGR